MNNLIKFVNALTAFMKSLWPVLAFAALIIRMLR